MVNRIYTFIHSNVEPYTIKDRVRYLYLLHVMFKEFPVLETPRLFLRAAELKDVPYILENHSDDSVMKYLGTKKLSTMLEAEQLIEDAQAVFKRKEGIRWVITLKEEDFYVGSVGMWRLDKLWTKAEIGYELSSKHWGKGIMTEALSAVLNFGFDRAKISIIEANVDIENLRSGHVLEKLGFKIAPYAPNQINGKQEKAETILYSMCKKYTQR